MASSAAGVNAVEDNAVEAKTADTDAVPTPIASTVAKLASRVTWVECLR
jgi:hypothetical protein